MPSEYTEEVGECEEASVEESDDDSNVYEKDFSFENDDEVEREFQFLIKSANDLGIEFMSSPSTRHASDKSGALEGYERYRELMDKLAENNVDKYVHLPMIAVMGDTSSGKSSLLSNLSLIELPSSNEITTRCPIQLKMKCSKKMKATVKVLWKDMPTGDDVDFAPRTIEENNWDDVTKAIFDAQTHIIKKTEKDVARDLVSVEIEAPHCENLTLIDLPGIVRTLGKDEKESIREDIESLMIHYLENERCVILAVLPSNVDYHNSQILADALKYDKETSRTIPVLTKPDLIDKGAEKAVKDLLLGERTNQYKFGFHMVKARKLKRC